MEVINNFKMAATEVLPQNSVSLSTRRTGWRLRQQFDLLFGHIKVTYGFKRYNGTYGVFINHLLFVVGFYQYYIVVETFYNAPYLETAGQKNSNRHVIFSHMIEN
jgi:hypothetical protein